MACHLQRLTSCLAFVLCRFLATALPAKAGTDHDDLRSSGSAYLWAAGVEGMSAAGDEIDISFTDLLDSLDGGGLAAPFGPLIIGDRLRRALQWAG